jgi:leucyl/phenylalanyl-tRNA--protein transferase
MELMEDSEYVFPHPRLADSSGLLAVGGMLDSRSLFIAYAFGIFPWYNHRHDPVFWWSPAPRFVVFPEKVKTSKSMRSLINNNKFSVTYNTCFEVVIRHCEMVHRKGQNGTWINEDIIKAYTELFYMGFITSVEVWEGGVLAGGLYGVSMGKVFYGESMFSNVPNASKFGFISLSKKLLSEGFTVIDCQQPTDHLKSLGGEFIPRARWNLLLSENRKFLLRNQLWFE